MLGLIKKLFGAKDAAPTPVEAAPAPIVDTADIAIAQSPDPVAAVVAVAPATIVEQAPAKKPAPKKPQAAKKPAAPKTAKPKAPPKPKAKPAA